MGPKLVAVAGPLRGREFDLRDGTVRLGRDPGNEISVHDAGIGRRQCEIVPSGLHFDLIQLDHQNVTLLNGLSVTRSVLGHGDEITVGSSRFRVQLREDELPPGQRVVQFDENDLELIRPSAVDVEDSMRDSGRAARELEALLRITSVLGSVKRLEELEQKLLETITSVVPADRGAIILVGETIDQFTSIFGWDRQPEGHHPVEVSRTVIDRALRDRVAVRWGPVPVSSDHERQPASPKRSLLAVPLVVFDRTVGVIYLDADQARVSLDDGHLQWLKAFGRVAAVALENARRAQWLENENRRLREELELDHSMVGESLAMQEVYQFIAKAAPSPATVLIRGESGTGKELVARAIHRNSPRAEGPFVAVNCAAVTETLLESEMFGHEKGAFTGAVAQKKGRIELADRGTLFLDEISELAPNLQAKLLRVLQEREFERVGGTHPIRVNIRVVAATNQDLEKAMNEGRFRPDLYYRLNVISVTLPSLRERREDIPLLATYFAGRHCERAKRPPLAISPEAMAYLIHYEWPGNVRELEHAMERAVVLGSGDVIRPENLPEDILDIDLPQRGLLPHFHEVVKRTKRELILKAVKQAGGNYTEAAKVLGLQPTYLHRLIRNLNLRDTIREQLT
jgi:Nif-specific regulatory protein